MQKGSLPWSLVHNKLCLYVDNVTETDNDKENPNIDEDQGGKTFVKIIEDGQ